jgi:hypothetical protein
MINKSNKHLLVSVFQEGEDRAAQIRMEWARAVD